MNYYNEFDPKAAAWLRELIRMKLIPEGIVDERSICDVDSAELVQYDQCHFFAGIGGWSRALQLARVRQQTKLWSGSCPCQAFSTAGKQKGFDDDRDLWPVFFNLIRQCRPSIVVGEQVEAAIRHGWLDRLQRDLEGEGYAVGSIVLGAHSVGSPHIRQRLYWGGRLADSMQPRYYDANGTSTEQNGDGSNRRVSTGGDIESADWRNAVPVWCRDGVYRPIPHPQSGIQPLAYGLPRGMVHGGDPLDPQYANQTQEGRNVRLKGYGNAIVPQVAAAFIGCFLGGDNLAEDTI
jgi:DNA (cytosine-5)-methyltransferase 1